MGGDSSPRGYGCCLRGLKLCFLISGLSRAASVEVAFTSVFWRTPRMSVQFNRQFSGGAHLDAPMKGRTVSDSSRDMQYANCYLGWQTAMSLLCCNCLPQCG